MGSSNSSKNMHQVKSTSQSKNKEPEWLEAFLKRTFFDSCLDHPIRRNELNKYCINCDLSACQYCMSSGAHRHHKILKVYRHVYKDVVSLASMGKYIDCSQIQPYKCNKRLVMAVNPLPHCGSISNNDVSCDICNRRLVEPHLYRYCSIACKVMASSINPITSPPVFLSTKENQNEAMETEKPSHKRKGVPRRAPFF